MVVRGGAHAGRDGQDRGQQAALQPGDEQPEPVPFTVGGLPARSSSRS
ncbi:hypothetical protein [Dactylosporangium cerinum]